MVAWQTISRDQTAEEIFVVVCNSGCRGPTPIFACWSVHAQAPRVEPFSRATKDKSSSASGRRCRYFALACRICRGIPGPRGHRRWGRFGRSDSLNNHFSGFTSSECCNLCGNWIDALVFAKTIFQFLSKAFARLRSVFATGRYFLALPCTNVCQLLVCHVTGNLKSTWTVTAFTRHWETGAKWKG